MVTLFQEIGSKNKPSQETLATRCSVFPGSLKSLLGLYTVLPGSQRMLGTSCSHDSRITNKCKNETSHMSRITKKYVKFRCQYDMIVTRNYIHKWPKSNDFYRNSLTSIAPRALSNYHQAASVLRLWNLHLAPKRQYLRSIWMGLAKVELIEGFAYHIL